ncbi:MAG: right-handed parallel beta-helix repeat-containing protein, partial [Hadesarchaea archaeon]|nr:right-handed parallel beta-helix repeat-containing protein [Hadesarchaea archaeon]
YCEDLIVENNTCSNNSDDGIYLYDSDELTVENNTCENNGDGIYVDEYCDDVYLTNNTCSNNSDDGIYLYDSDSFTVDNNTCENNYSGIYVDEDCDYLDLINNNCSNNSEEGIYICWSDECTVENNTCENNAYGIYLYDAEDCTIFHNYLLNNTENNAYDDSGNDWDESGEGNYWSDWQPPEHPDNNGDGIVDEARLITGDSNEDYYPLVLPDFSISVSPTSRSVQVGGSTTATVSLTPVPTVENFAVSLTASGQPSGVSVSFSPSSGVLPSSSTMAINVGSSVPAGTYTITVKGTCVADRERTSIFTLMVSAILPSGYSTGAGTITPAAPVTVQIQNSPITGLQINVNNTVQNVNVTVTQSTSTPSGVAIGAPGATYSYLDITVQNLSDADIDYVVISFKVEKSWLNASGIDPTTVALYRYSGGVWMTLPTEIVSEDATYFYYSARSPGLSVFSISGYAKVTPTPPSPAPPPPSPGPLPEPSPTSGGAAPLGAEFWLVILGGAVAIVIALLGVILQRKQKIFK